MRELQKWDCRFLNLAAHISNWSKDPSTKTGAVIVRPNGSIASLGFNGFPQLMSDAEELYADRTVKYSRIIHAEINALIFAREVVQGYTVYTYPLAPCDRCCVQLIQAGIVRFVFPYPSQDGISRWGDALKKTKEYIDEAGLTWVEL
jgi:dCMP deaminase